MIIKASEIKKYMELHNVDKVPVEVVNTEVPAFKPLRQSARTLAKRLVVTAAHPGNFGYGRDKVESVQISYAMYNSFKKSRCYISPDFEVDVLTGADGQKILNEFAEHGNGLEKKFRETFAEIHPQIQAKIKAAAQLVNEAEELSEKHGIPFRPQTAVAGHAMSYIPDSFEAIYGDLKQDDDVYSAITDLTGAYGDEYSGWQSSQVC